MPEPPVRPYMIMYLDIASDATLPQTAKLLHARLDLYARNDSGNAWPSAARLAEDVGCSERTARACLKVLVKRKLVTRRKRTGKTSVYTPCRNCTPAETAPHPCRNCRGTPAESAPYYYN